MGHCIKNFVVLMKSNQLAIVHINDHGYMIIHIIIKTHDSESWGQVEVAIIQEIKNTQLATEWAIYT